MISARPLPPIELLQSLFAIKGEGVVRRCPAGNQPGGVRPGYEENGYRRVRVGSQVIHEHRIVLALAGVTIPNGYDVDHIDGNGLNNSISNLRAITRSQNKQNTAKARSDSHTGFMGVHCRNGKYIPKIFANGRRIELGVFGSAEEAHDAYVEAKRRLHPAMVPERFTP